MPAEPSFLFVTCQVGAEAAVKAEMARLAPDSRFAFSRPGFLIFRLPLGQMGSGVFFASPSPDTLSERTSRRPQRDSPPVPVFARAWGISLGKAEGSTGDELSASVAAHAVEQPYDAVHVWQRD